ncbi:MAG TPA: hypothetical protein VGJ84_01215 [Polyangiaceae bacterium]|jgi:hypothetical protein
MGAFQEDARDVEHVIEDINRRRKLKLFLAVGTIIAVALLGLLFAQFSSGPGIPYGY